MALDNLSVVIPERLKVGISKVWESEVCKIAEPLFKPKNSSFAKFFPTDNCDVITRASFSEFFKAKSMLDAKLIKSTSFGYVMFPGVLQFQSTFTLIIPLNLTGKVELDGVVMDTDHHYYFQKRSDDQKSTLKVHEGSKIVMLLVTNLVILM